MAAHGINNLGRAVVDVLIPIERRRRDQNFMHVMRTSRMPAILYTDDQRWRIANIQLIELSAAPPG